MLAMSDEDSRKSTSPQRSKSTVSGNANEGKQTNQDKSAKDNNSVKPNMVYIVSIITNIFYNILFL